MFSILLRLSRPLIYGKDFSSFSLVLKHLRSISQFMRLYFVYSLIDSMGIVRNS